MFPLGAHRAAILDALEFAASQVGRGPDGAQVLPHEKAYHEKAYRAALIALRGSDEDFIPGPEAGAEATADPPPSRPWPYDGPEGRGRLTGNLG